MTKSMTARECPDCAGGVGEIPKNEADFCAEHREAFEKWQHDGDGVILPNTPGPIELESGSRT